MTCLINARAYRDGSAAAPRWPDTSYWVLLGLSWACTRAPRAQGSARSPICLDLDFEVQLLGLGLEVPDFGWTLSWTWT
jgi:hypothetical protein